MSASEAAPWVGFFLADSRMPAMTEADLEATRHALDQASGRLRAAGVAVRHLGSAYIRSRGQWLCLFSARGQEDIRRVSDIAQIAFNNIEEVVAVSGEAE